MHSIEVKCKCDTHRLFMSIKSSIFKYQNSHNVNSIKEHNVHQKFHFSKVVKLKNVTWIGFSCPSRVPFSSSKIHINVKEYAGKYIHCLHSFLGCSDAPPKVLYSNICIAFCLLCPGNIRPCSFSGLLQHFPNCFFYMFRSAGCLCLYIFRVFIIIILIILFISLRCSCL